MRKTLLTFGIIIFGGAASADFSSDMKEKVKGIEERFKAIDTRVNEALATKSGADFAEYAERRNEVVRFVSEPRREISQARALLEQSSGQRIQTEQELKVALEGSEIDLTDDDSKPLPLSALMPRIEQAIAEFSKELEVESKSFSDINASRNEVRNKLKDLKEEERKDALVEDQRLREKLASSRNNMVALRSKRDQLKRAKDLLVKAVEFSNFSPSFESEVKRLESVESRASQRIQQIDEAIFNYLLIQSNDKRYTLYSTLVFGVAVVIVIGSFFFVAYKSESVRNSIFANDSGLQFVTLFSLVIAIILFGVLKILEGRELAALLGGLSGYILGRGGISRQSSSSSTQVSSGLAAPQPAATG